MIGNLINKLSRIKWIRGFVNKLGISSKTISMFKEWTKPSKSKSQRLKDIESRVEDLNFKIDLLMDYFVEASKANKAVGARAEIQQSLFATLSKFNECCRKHSILYWLDYGTLLGAKRHAGFIPWDDDADVSMTDSEFQKLKKLYDAGILTDCSIEMIYDNQMAHFIYKDVLIDIFIYDEFEDRIKMRMVTYMFRDDMSSIPNEIMFPLSEITFENEKFLAPANVDMYLRARFGNYHTLPKKKHIGDKDIFDKKVIFYPDEKI